MDVRPRRALGYGASGSDRTIASQNGPSQVTRRAPPSAFFWLHWAAWPVGVIGGAMAAALATAGLPVKRISEIVGVAALAFSLEIIWAPMVGEPHGFRRHAPHRFWHLGRAEGCGRGASSVAPSGRARRQLHRHRRCLWT